MRDFVKSLSAGERFSAILIAVAFFSVIIPAAIELSISTLPGLPAF
ncbi:MAG TPA: hypothetical protein VKV32_05335 [Stellaceae bacterium]|nr:hypothetical protein [Stellaceae bacterium]